MLLASATAVTVAACKKRPSGPSPRELRKTYQTYADTVIAGVAAVQKVVAAAPAPTVGADCSKAGLTLSQPFEHGTRGPRPAAGNTEIVSFERLEDPLYGDHNGVDQLAAENPLAASVRLMAEGPAVNTTEAFAPNGFLSTASDYPRPDDAYDVERTKQLNHLVVLRVRPSVPEDYRARSIQVFLVEFPSGRLTCSFTVRGEAAPALKDERYITYNSRGEKVGDGSTNQVAAAAIQAAIETLQNELKQRFSLALPKIVLY